MPGEPPNPVAPMRVTPALVFRFLLELALLVALGYWGWHRGGGGTAGVALAILLPVAGGAVWGVFGTLGDPGRGRPVVPVPGPLRLALEVALFALGAYGLWTSGSRAAAETLLTVTALHFAVTYDRVLWLLRH